MCKIDRILLIQKNFLHLAIAALLPFVVLSSCSQKDTPESEINKPDMIEKPIIFSSYIVDNKTQEMPSRASNLEDNNVTVFKLYGYKNTEYNAVTREYSGLQNVFPAYNVTWTAHTANTTTSNKFDWEYVAGSQTIKYWDFSARAYRYAAYAPASASVTIQESADKIIFKIPADASTEAKVEATPFYSELWFSNNHYPDYAAYGSSVNMQFKKPFARVRFMFVDNKGNAVTTSSVQYLKTTAGSIAFKPTDNSGISTKGSVSVTYPLTGTEVKEIVVSTPTGTIPALTDPFETTLAFATTNNKYYTLLPNTSQGEFTLSLTYNGEQRTATVPAQYMQWQAGYEYTYVFKLTDDAVSFAPELWVYTKWQAGYVSETEW